jgi:hypothetical protein
MLFNNTLEASFLMAFKLSDYITHGFLINKHRYSTRGQLYLRGHEMPLFFELTGNCEPDLRGKYIRFFISDDSYDTKNCPDDLYESLQRQQIGPTGYITAAEWVRKFDCPIEEFVRRARLGEAPPTRWVRRFTMEWYSQDGRMFFELADPVMEECIEHPSGDSERDVWRPLPMLSKPPDRDPDARPDPDSAPDITVIQRTDEGVRSERLSPEDIQEIKDGESDPLERELNRESREIDRLVEGGDPDFLAEMEMMDDLMTSSDGEGVGNFIDDADKMPRPEDLNEEAAEVQVKSILMRLAFFHITVDVCEHFTMRDIYAWLLERAAENNNHLFRQARGTGWVQHISTFEYCPECEAESERIFQEYEKERQEEEKEGNADEGDLPV